jgi:hypothetical protein
MIESMPLSSLPIAGGDAPFEPAVEKVKNFEIRRAVERLREGLFDPVAVRLLTAHEERLRKEIESNLDSCNAGKSPSLCVVGAYGQGKSHSLFYVQDLALRAGFVTSLVNLDFREIPFHDFRAVYRELLGRAQFPDSGVPFPARWRRWAQEQLKERDSGEGILDLIPDGMPHLFRAVLAAMVRRNVSLSEKEKGLKKHAAYRPTEFPALLVRALEGEAVPVRQLRNTLKYRQVAFHGDGPLSCRGSEPFIEMVRGLSRLFRKMGYRGWVLLFDEGESIAQGNIFARGKAYRLLHRLFAPEDSSAAFLYPVFGFTDDFFARVQSEDYDRAFTRRGKEIRLFDRNYAVEWRNLNVYRLDDLSRREWQELSRRLARLHAQAYGWNPPEALAAREMANRLDAMRGGETRFKLKALVDCLDRVQQARLL